MRIGAVLAVAACAAGPVLAEGPASAEGLTAAEAQAFRAAVGACWLLDPALAEVWVEVRLELDRGGRVAGEVSLVEGGGGDAAAVARAFEVARRALLRCQGDGYGLPPAKFPVWREIELLFDPRAPLG